MVINRRKRKLHYLYLLTFLNGKKYVGVSENVITRIRTHFSNAHRGSNLAVHQAIRKYSGRLSITIVAVGYKNYIYLMEQKFISFLNTTHPKHGYNMSLGGETSPVAGIGHSEATRKKMSESQKKRIRTPEEMAHFIYSRKGKKLTEEHKQKLRVPKTEEHKRNLSIALKKAKINNRGKNNPMYGRKHSEKTKQLIKEKRKLQIIMEANQFRKAA